MSTSDPTPASKVTPGSANLPSRLDSSAELPAGIPTPAELARLANEMFNELPQELQLPVAKAAATVLPPNSAFTGNPYAAVPSPTAPAVPGLLAGLTEAQPGAFVAVPDRNVAPDLSTPVQSATRPPVQGGGIDPYASPAFAFLADARPLFVAHDKA
jgi:hypothetical protein